MRAVTTWVLVWALVVPAAAAHPGLGGHVTAAGVLEAEAYDHPEPSDPRYDPGPGLHGPGCDPSPTGLHTTPFPDTTASGGHGVLISRSLCGIIFRDVALPFAAAFVEVRARVPAPNQTYLLSIYGDDNLDGPLACGLVDAFSGRATGGGWATYSLAPAAILEAGSHDLHVEYERVAGDLLTPMALDHLRLEPLSALPAAPLPDDGAHPLLRPVFCGPGAACSNEVVWSFDPLTCRAVLSDLQRAYRMLAGFHP